MFDYRMLQLQHAQLHMAILSCDEPVQQNHRCGISSAVFHITQFQKFVIQLSQKNAKFGEFAVTTIAIQKSQIIFQV